MDWRGIEPLASSMPRKRSTADLPALFSEMVYQYNILTVSAVSPLIHGRVRTYMNNIELFRQYLATFSSERVRQNSLYYIR